MGLETKINKSSKKFQREDTRTLHTQCIRLNKKFCPKDFSISVFVELDVFFFVTSCSCSLFEKLVHADFLCPNNGTL
jgi:hypothetical protein